MFRKFLVDIIHPAQINHVENKYRKIATDWRYWYWFICTSNRIPPWIFPTSAFETIRCGSHLRQRAPNIRNNWDKCDDFHAFRSRLPCESERKIETPSKLNPWSGYYMLTVPPASVSLLAWVSLLLCIRAQSGIYLEYKLSSTTWAYGTRFIKCFLPPTLFGHHEVARHKCPK